MRVSLLRGDIFGVGNWGVRGLGELALLRWVVARSSLR